MSAPSSPPHPEALPEGTGGPRTPRPVSDPGRRRPFPLVAGWRRPAAGVALPADTAPRPLAVARPRRMRQAGRAALLWAFAFFAAAQLAMLPFEDRWPGTAAYTLRQKWEQLGQLTAREPDRPLLVMLGSSRTELALQAGRLNGLPGPDGKPYLAYNFGVAAGGPFHERLRLQEMLEAGIRPRLLLVEFLPPLLNQPRRHYASEEDWTTGYWLSLPQLCRLWPYYSRPDRKARNWAEARLAPWWAFRPYILASVLENLPHGFPVPPRLPYDPWGWRLVPPVLTYEDGTRARKKAHDEFESTLQHLHIGKGPSRAMRDLMELCRRENIPVVLVLMPESTTFRSWYAPEGRAAALGLLEELRTTYGAGVIDATAWLADGHFMDGHHVLAGGAMLFTTRLREELARMLAGPAEARRQHVVR